MASAGLTTAPATGLQKNSGVHWALEFFALWTTLIKQKCNVCRPRGSYSG